MGCHIAQPSARHCQHKLVLPVDPRLPQHYIDITQQDYLHYLRIHLQRLFDAMDDWRIM